MATKYKQIVSLSFIGAEPANPGEHRPNMVEIDEEDDVLSCRETFDRQCVHVRPLKLAKVDLPGDEDTRRVPVLINDDIKIEIMTSRGPAETTHDRADGWSEVHIQVEDNGTSRTSAGSFGLEPSDLVVVPSGSSHESVSDAPSTRLIVSTRRPVHVAHGYPADAQPVPVANGADGATLVLQPSKVADAIEEGPAGGKHFELVVNEDIMIETTFRSDDQRIYHRGYDQDEVHFQLSGRRATRTAQGEYVLETGDMLLIPPGVTHRNIGGMPTVRIVLYTKNPLAVADEYTQRLGTAWGA